MYRYIFLYFVYKIVKYSIAHFIVLWFIIKRLLEKIGWWVLKKGRIDIKLNIFF